MALKTLTEPQLPPKRQCDIRLLSQWHMDFLMLVGNDLGVRSPSMGAFSGDRVSGKSSIKMRPQIETSLKNCDYIGRILIKDWYP
jgi:hypothetical protein